MAGLTVNYTAVVHCGSIRQTAQVVHVQGSRDSAVQTAEPTSGLALSPHPHLQAGDKGIVTFRFTSHPEYVTVGAKFIFREGRMKGLGKVVKVCTAGVMRARGQPMW
jgi:GTPase